MEVNSIIALIIILGLGSWVSEKNKEKINTEASQKARNEFMLIMNELEVYDISNEFVQWLETEIRIRTGKDGLTAYTERLRNLASEEGKRAATVQIMLLYQRYLDEKQNTKEYMQWHSYVEAFRKMNKAQQKHQIERFKKVAKPDSKDDSDKLSLLELIYLGSDNKTTEIMLGSVRLFTLKEK